MGASGEEILNRFERAADFVAYARDRLCRHPGRRPAYPPGVARDPGTSAVLFLLGNRPGRSGFDPCLVLNKRSRRVRQPGDLCCPGGGVHPAVDRWLAKFLSLPGLALKRWPHWAGWRRHPDRAARLALLLATSLRESLEEMRLNPLGVEFIGPMAAQRLVLFNRRIFPMAGWAASQRRFYPNWEVERIVRVPIRSLLRAENYGRYRLRPPGAAATPGLPGPHADYPCFLHRDGHGTELLWGATYRITAAFLETVFHFQPPPADRLPVRNGVLGTRYLGGES